MAGGAAAVLAGAGGAGVRAVLTAAGVVVAGGAAAVRALAHGAGVRAVLTGTGVALVVVAVVLAVGVAVVDVVDVVVVDDGEVTAVRTVRVVVGLSGAVLSGGSHDRAPWYV